MTALVLILFATILFSSCNFSKNAGLGGSPPPKKELSDKEKMDFDYLFYNATKEKILGNYATAANLYEQSLRIDPTNAAANYEMANIFNFQNRSDAAITYALKASKLEPKNDWYLLLYAECLQKTGKLDAATKVHEKLLKEHPERIDYYYNLANAYADARHYKEALKVYDDLESKIGTSEEIFLQKLGIYQQQGDLAKAEKELVKMTLAFPKETKYWGMLSEICIAMKEYDKAFNALNKMKELDPNDPQVHFSLSNYYRQKGQTEESYKELKLAFANPDADIDTKVKILLSYYTVTETHTELKTQAMELCSLLVETHPKEAKGYSMYGDFLLREQRPAEARNMYRKALEFDKERYAIWNQILIIDSELNDFDSMEKEGKEATELFPNQPIPYLFAGMASVNLKKYKEAVEFFNNGLTYVIQNEPLKAQFYSSLGDVYHYLSEHEKSDEAYEKALKIEPKNEFVLNNYAYYLSLRKEKLDRAAEMSKLSNELLPNNSSFLDTYAWILYQQEKYEEAKEWMKKALDNKGSSSAVVVEHYGDILFKLGNKGEALEYWIKAKSLGEGSKQLEKKIADKTLYE